MIRKKILLVEDHDEVREFIRNCLEATYEVLEADQGQKGWEIATTELPDLVITDVAMPEMNGNEFCRHLKNDQRTSHIPVIMLTAKVAEEQQIEGLESGADLYLTKPFSVLVLQNYVSNLLKAKELLRQLYSQKIYLEPSNVEVGTVDKQFMERLMAIIEENLGNAAFGVSQLSREIGMSKAVLYKKFDALVHITIGEFIKNMRLKKAAIILANDKLSINQVAWEVGFNDSKYFSKEFKRFFGRTPSEYASGPGNHRIDSANR